MIGPVLPPTPQQPSCAATSCSHVQQYWPVWICAVSAGGALVSKGYFDRWDVAGGFVATGVIVSLFISCFRGQERPITPNTIREHRENLAQNNAALGEVVAGQNARAALLDTELQNLEEGRVVVTENIERQRSAEGHLGLLVAGEEKDREELSRVAQEHQRIEAATQNLAQEEEITEEVKNANDRLASIMKRAQAALNKESRVHPIQRSNS